jgi:short-subunit dehydrogenase
MLHVARTAVRIAGSQILVTGASGGLGGAIARALDDRDAHLIVTGRRTDALDSLAAGLKRAQVLTCDLADRDQVERLAAEIEGVDILVANAALPASGTLDDFTTKELDRALDVNLRAPMLLAQHLAPRMVARGRGHLVFVSSMGGKVPAPRLSVYAATKYGLRGFAACLRQELAGTGVGVSAVFPGRSKMSECLRSPAQAARAERCRLVPLPTASSGRSARTARRWMSRRGQSASPPPSRITSRRRSLVCRVG